MYSHFLAVTPAITLHYRDNGAASLPPLLLLHSLSDNTHVFDAIIAAGLDSRFRIIAPDMRGRGASSRPATDYGLEAHCRDIVALLNHLGIEQSFVAGHSFGGLLGLYFAAHYPQYVRGLTMIDAAAEMHPLTPMFVLLLGDRLGRWYPSQDAFIMNMRAMPFITYWDTDMRRAFLADTTSLPDGSVYVKTQKHHIMQSAVAVEAIPKRKWRELARRVQGPALVLSGAQAFLQGQHMVEHHKAVETAVLLPAGAHAQVRGNHVTMMFGDGAHDIADAIIERFVPSARFDLNAVPLFENDALVMA